MLLVDDVLYVTVVIFQNSTKGSFQVDLENTSIGIYQENGSLIVVKWFCLSKTVGSLSYWPFVRPFNLPGPTLYDGIIQLRISSLKMLSLGKEIEFSVRVWILSRTVGTHLQGRFLNYYSLIFRVFEAIEWDICFRPSGIKVDWYLMFWTALFSLVFNGFITV